LAELMVVGSAVVVAFHPNVLYAAIGLLFTFLGVAVMFLYAGADFLAGAQVVIYVGGVVVLVLFAIMLTHWMYQIKLTDVKNKMALPILILTIGFLPILYKTLKTFGNPAVPENFKVFATAPKTELVGQALLNNYLLPFEGITVLLLAALVGAVWLARPGK